MKSPKTHSFSKKPNISPPPIFASHYYQQYASHQCTPQTASLDIDTLDSQLTELLKNQSHNQNQFQKDFGKYIDIGDQSKITIQGHNNCLDIQIFYSQDLEQYLKSNNKKDKYLQHLDQNEQHNILIQKCKQMQKQISNLKNIILQQNQQHQLSKTKVLSSKKSQFQSLSNNVILLKQLNYNVNRQLNQLKVFYQNQLQSFASQLLNQIKHQKNTNIHQQNNNNNNINKNLQNQINRLNQRFVQISTQNRKLSLSLQQKQMLLVMQLQQNQQNNIKLQQKINTMTSLISKYQEQLSICKQMHCFIKQNDNNHQDQHYINNQKNYQSKQLLMLPKYNHINEMNDLNSRQVHLNLTQTVNKNCQQIAVQTQTQQPETAQNSYNPPSPTINQQNLFHPTEQILPPSPQPKHKTSIQTKNNQPYHQPLNENTKKMNNSFQICSTTSIQIIGTSQQNNQLQLLIDNQNHNYNQLNDNKNNIIKNTIQNIDKNNNDTTVNTNRTQQDTKIHQKTFPNSGQPFQDHLQQNKNNSPINQHSQLFNNCNFYQDNNNQNQKEELLLHKSINNDDVYNKDQENYQYHKRSASLNQSNKKFTQNHIKNDKASQQLTNLKKHIQDQQATISQLTQKLSDKKSKQQLITSQIIQIHSDQQSLINQHNTSSNTNYCKQYPDIKCLQQSVNKQSFTLKTIGDDSNKLLTKISKIQQLLTYNQQKHTQYQNTINNKNIQLQKLSLQNKQLITKQHQIKQYLIIIKQQINQLQKQKKFIYSTVNNTHNLLFNNESLQSNLLSLSNKILSTKILQNQYTNTQEILKLQQQSTDQQEEKLEIVRQFIKQIMKKVKIQINITKDMEESLSTYNQKNQLKFNLNDICKQAKKNQNNIYKEEQIQGKSEENKRRESKISIKVEKEKQINEEDKEYEKDEGRKEIQQGKVQKKEEIKIIEVQKKVQVPIYIQKLVQVIKQKQVPIQKQVIRQIEVQKKVEIPIYVQKKVEVIKQVIKQISVPIEVIKQIQVPIQKQIIKEVEVLKILQIPIYIQKQVQVIKQIQKIKQIQVPIQKQVIRQVEVLKIVEMPIYIQKEVEVIKQVPIEKQVIKYVEVQKTVEVPLFGQRKVQIIKQIQVPIQKQIIKVVEVLKIVEIPIYIQKQVQVIKQIIKLIQIPIQKQVIRCIEVQKNVEIPIQVQKKVEIIKQVIKYIQVPIEVIRQIQVPIEKQIVREVEVLKILQVPISIQKQVQVTKLIIKQICVPIEKQVIKQVEVLHILEIPIHIQKELEVINKQLNNIINEQSVNELGDCYNHNQSLIPVCNQTHNLSALFYQNIPQMHKQIVKTFQQNS